MNVSAWKLYHACFKDGEEVVVIDEDDNYHWGKLETHDEYCILHRSTLKDDKVLWENVVFMAHDGFPVARIHESSRAAKAAEKLSTSKAANRVRQILTATVCDRCFKVVDEAEVAHEEGHWWYKDSATGKRIPTPKGVATKEDNVICLKCRALCEPVTIHRGDPWEIKCATAQLFNVGNHGLAYWGEDDEEIIVATSGDGAIAHISAIDTIFNVEAA